MKTTSLSPSDRRLQTTFLISIGLVTGSAGLILAASLSRIFPAAFSPLVAAATLFYVDHRRRKLLSTLTANLLGLAALAAAFNNFSDSNLERLTAGTDFLVFLTWIVLGMQKAPRQYWWLAALSVLQITTAGVLTASVGFGTALFLMSLLMIWTLSVFSLYRTALWHNQQTATLGVAGAGEPRVRAPWRRRALKFLRGFLGLAPRSTSVVRQNPGTAGVIVRHGLDRDPAEFWTGWRFGLSVLGSWIISILVGLFVFAVFPRIWVSGGIGLANAASAGGAGTSITGFSDSVQLGQTGSLLQSNRLAFTFHVRSLPERKPETVETLQKSLKLDEFQLRGSVFAAYDRGRWISTSPQFDIPDMNRPYPQMAAFHEITLTAQQPQSRVVLAPHPIARITQPEGRAINLRSFANMLTWLGPSSASAPVGPMTVIVECPSLLIQPEFASPFWHIDPRLPASVQQLRFARLNKQALQFYRMGEISNRFPRLHELARRLSGTRNRLASEVDRLRNTLEWLNSENGFRYTLDQPTVPFDKDPVEYFLFESRAGHCEYFASAAVLLLQAMGIPARLVTGYSGSEWNPEKQHYEVLERHAHAWGEAWIGGRWVAFDPTPLAARIDSRRAIAERSLLSGFQAVISDFWKGSVNSMSAERQRAIFEPVLQAARNTFERIRRQGIWPFIREFFTALLAPSSGRLTLSSAAAWILLISLLGLAVRTVHGGAGRSLFNAFRDRFLTSRTHVRSVIRFYSQFCELCERGGLAISEAATARENAEAARIAFLPQLSSAGLEDLPFRIATAFNLVRFGRGLLSHEEATAIGNDLTRFAAVIQSSLDPGK